MAGRPTHRITINRKDGNEISFKDYRGEQVTKKHCPIGVLFPNRNGNGYNFVLERKVTLDPDQYWVNVYEIDDRRDSEEEKPRQRAGGGRRRPAPRDEQPEEEDTSDLDLDEES